MYCVNICVVCI